MAVMLPKNLTIYGKLSRAPKSESVCFGQVPGPLYVQRSRFYHYPVLDALSLQLPAGEEYFGLIPGAQRACDEIQIGVETDRTRMLFVGYVNGEPQPVFMRGRPMHLAFTLRLTDIVTTFERKGKRWVQKTVAHNQIA
jgi:hypothetical protein